MKPVHEALAHIKGLYFRGLFYKKALEYKDGKNHPLLKQINA